MPLRRSYLSVAKMERERYRGSDDSGEQEEKADGGAGAKRTRLAR